MAKKIIMVDEGQPTTDTTVVPQSEFQDAVNAKLDTIDWKLWEILKIAQRWELTVVGAPPTEVPTPLGNLTPHAVDIGMKEIIVDEDDEE